MATIKRLLPGLTSIARQAHPAPVSPPVPGLPAQRAQARAYEREIRREERAYWSSWLKDLLVAGLCAAVFYLFIFQLAHIKGPSMLPGYVDGEIAGVSKMHKSLSIYSRGDVWVFRTGGTAGLIKRVIGLPGDIVEIKAGVVFVNGFPLEEGYVTLPKDETLPPVTVGKDTLYILGDNRSVSRDSRAVGPVPVSMCVGKVIFIMWPASAFRIPV